jgi:TRAP-type C4-dicarboxylate transport system permease small subunit
VSRGPRRALSVRVVEGVLALLMLLLIGLVSAQIFMRYVVHSPLVWSEELARMSFVYLTFIGAGLAFHRGENLRLGVLTDALPERARLRLRAVTYVVEALFIGIVLVYSVPLLRRLYPAPTPALEWSMDCFYAGVAIGGAVIFVCAAAGFVHTVAALRRRG